MRAIRWSLLAVVAAILVGVAALSQSRVELREGPAAQPSTAPVTSSAPPKVERAPGLRWIVAGGGPSPGHNEVSIEQDLALAVEVFGTGGQLLYAAGRRTQAVQLARKEPAPDRLKAALAEIFDPRQRRATSFRATTLPADGQATVQGVLDALQQALLDGSGPLLLYVSGHGRRGRTPRDNAIELWGGELLTVERLAETLDRAPPDRMVQVVVTTCYSGGFAELAFARADADWGAARRTRCGLFAAPATQIASGCDPDPDRGRQQGYGLHFLHALRREDRDGRALSAAEVDIDGDGRISPLEAHTRARVASTSVDVPTTTSERWLRHAAPITGPLEQVTLPEEDRVIAKLSQRLRLVDQPDEARRRLDEVRRKLTAKESQLDGRVAALDRAALALGAELLALWPVLDDPWHPDFADMLAEGRDDIADHLEDSKAAIAYRKATDALDALDAEIHALRLEIAPLLRLVRALDTKLLAARLRARGGEGWVVYQRLLACERTPL